jgi:arylsulfatase A-like enzyme
MIRAMKISLVLLLLSWNLAISSVAADEQDRVTSEKRPNLILLVTDDHPFDAMGCAGHAILSTPNMDALAERGSRFTHAFVTTPICAASRASIFSGRYERSHGYTFGQPALDEEIVHQSYPSLLRQAGYRVGFVGKFGVKVSRKGREEMFDEYVPGTYPYFRSRPKRLQEGVDAVPPRHLTEINADHAIDFLRSRDERPFCLSLSFQAPHAEDNNPDQFVWPSSCDELYRGDVIPPPATADPAFFQALPEFLRSGLNRERWKWRFDTPEKHARMVKGYYRMLSGVDQAVGRLMRTLDELGLVEETVIMLIGDNGYFLGERGYAGKWTMHDRSIRVPLIISDPRRKAEKRGELIDAFALNVDIAPTLLELAGVKVPAAMQGQSLCALLDDASTTWRDEVFSEHLWESKRIPRTEGLRTRDWKYIRYPDHPEYEELYDLQSDPREEHNLARDEQYTRHLVKLRERCSLAASRAEG